MGRTRAALVLVAAAAVAVVLVSGGHSADPRTPAALPGLPPPFLGTAVVGGGGLTAAVDAYGAVVDLRAPGPAGRALIENPLARQVAGTVAADTGIVPRVRIGGEGTLPLWRADAVEQRYLTGTNVVQTTALFGEVRVVTSTAIDGRSLAMLVQARRDGDRGPASASADPGARVAPAVSVNAEGAACATARQGAVLTLVCMSSSVPLSREFLAGQPSGTALAVRRGEDPLIAAARAIVQRESIADRSWLARARPLGAAAPAWAGRMYERSLLTLRALTDRRTGAVAAGARDGWAHVWPRDAGAAALAFAAAGHGAEARQVARFLLGLDLAAAARFDGNGAPVPGRAAQGDAWGWAAAAARATGLPTPRPPLPWRNRPDYHERSSGTYLANAIAGGEVEEPQIEGAETSPDGSRSVNRPGAAGIAAAFGTARGLVREAGAPGSGLDSAAAWAVRPFATPALYPAARRTLLRLAAGGTRFGMTPGEGWREADPWMAPTAWSAWALAALADHARRQGWPRVAARDRRAALGLLADLRRAATPAGALPERVDARTGVPRSTTPLAWPHAFAILALRELWP